MFDIGLPPQPPPGLQPPQTPGGEGVHPLLGALLLHAFLGGGRGFSNGMPAPHQTWTTRHRQQLYGAPPSFGAPAAPAPYMPSLTPGAPGGGQLGGGFGGWNPFGTPTPHDPIATLLGHFRRQRPTY
jgi:hypothetical protein